MIVVVDASACASFLIPDEAGPFADFARRTVASHDVHVPPHWPVEIASILRNACRRKRIAEHDLARLAKVATDIASDVTIVDDFTIAGLIDMALAHDLTPYDAAYVALARALRAPILTTDSAMIRACIHLKIEVLQP